MELITNMDLYKNKYAISILESNIDNLDLFTILKTQQHLTYDFVIDYILNPIFQITPEEKTIDMYDVVRHQSNIDIDILKFKIKTNQSQNQ